MKRKLVITLFLISLTVFFFGCEEGPTDVLIVDNNSWSQNNYSLRGKTFVYEDVGLIVTKTTVTTATSGSITTETEEIPRSQLTGTYTFGELSDGVGSFTFTYSSTFLPAIDLAYDSTAEDTVSVDVDYDISDIDLIGYSGQLYYEVEASGEYQIYESENGVQYYNLRLDDVSKTSYEVFTGVVSETLSSFPVVDLTSETILVKTTERVGDDIVNRYNDYTSTSTDNTADGYVFQSLRITDGGFAFGTTLDFVEQEGE